MHSSRIWNEETRALVRIAATVASAPIALVRRTMTDELARVSPELVDEVLLQSYLFAGFPRTLNAMAAWRDISGVAAPLSDPSANQENAQEWIARGERTCQTVYGPVYEALRTNIQKLHPALDQWMLVEGYGKVLARPQLDLPRRELCIVAACATSEQLPQLRSHLRGALNAGASMLDLSATIAALSDLSPPTASVSALAELARLEAA